MANPNIVEVVNINGKTDLISLTSTGQTTLLSNAAASGKVLKINMIQVANIDGSNAADITVDLFRGATPYRLASTISVPADSTVVVLSKDTAIYLEEGDSIRCTASATGDLEAVCSYEIITDA